MAIIKPDVVAAGKVDEIVQEVTFPACFTLPYMCKSTTHGGTAAHAKACTGVSTHQTKTNSHSSQIEQTNYSNSSTQFRTNGN